MNRAATALGTTEQVDFSPALGGLLFRIYRRSHLAGDSLELLKRRVLVISGVAWLPLLVLALANHRAGVAIPFWFDIDLHVRLLIALPVLICAEPFAHRRITPIVKRFADRQIVREEDLPKFRQIVGSARSARDSVLLEIVLLLLVYTVGAWVWRSQMTVPHSTWYATFNGRDLRPTAAGYWLTFVSVPLVQFILLRWYARMCIWFWLLWRISRLKLHLIATHPDRAGGIGFLGVSTFAFTPFLFAQSTLLAGAVASRVIFQGASLMSFKSDALTLVVATVGFILGPLLFFAPNLDAAKRNGKAEYGLLASRYVLDFESKWISNAQSDSKELLGTCDIQSLADLSNSYTIVHDMRPFPFWIDDVMRLLVAAAAPLVPLSLLVMPLDELLLRLLRLLF